MIKLIVTDMDGTLLDSDHNMPEDFFEIAEKLHNDGVIFAVASGRQFYTLLEQFYEIKDSIFFIAENGTYVVYKNDVIHSDTIEKSAAAELIKTGRNIDGAFLVLCCKNGAYVESTNVEFLNEAKKYYRKIEIVDDITKVNDEILKVTLCDFKNSEKNSYTHFRNFEDRFKVAIAGEIWLDITNLSANKGKAIEQIQKEFNISYDETMVFGDFLNDIEMMKTAKYSYAMKNAHPKILEAANFITEFTNNEAGVTKTITKLCFPEVIV